MSNLSATLELVNNRWFRRSIGWTGIEIGCHEIKMAQVRKHYGLWELSSVWSIETPIPFANASVESSANRTNRAAESFGWLTSKEILEYGLAPILSDTENLNSLFHGRNSAATLSDGMIEYRELDLPQCDLFEARSIVCSEVALEVECEPHELITDCWKLPKSRSRTESSSYAAVSLNSSTAEQMALDLLTLGFDCQVLDAMPCAMALATQMVVEDKACVTLAIDMGYAQATMTLVQDGQPLLTRVLRQCSLLSLLESIATAFEVSLADAQTLLFQSNTSEEPQFSGLDSFSNPLLQRTESYLHALAVEINRTLEYSERAFHSMIPQNLLLMGAGTRVPFVAKTLERKCKMPARAWEIKAPDGLFGYPSLASYAIAAGLSSLAWESTWQA
jgi:Tfp pilus assembly PilM family ATPase